MPINANFLRVLALDDAEQTTLGRLCSGNPSSAMVAESGYYFSGVIGGMAAVLLKPLCLLCRNYKNPTQTQ